MQLICLLMCNFCGVTEEIYISLTQDIVINEKIAIEICKSAQPAWGYDEETDEWMCKHCMHRPFAFNFTAETLEQMKRNVDKKTWEYEHMKQQMAVKLHIDSDSVLINEINVNRRIDLYSLITTFYISPLGMSWLDIKKRHPVKESKSRCLDGG